VTYDGDLHALPPEYPFTICEPLQFLAALRILAAERNLRA